MPFKLSLFFLFLVSSVAIAQQKGCESKYFKPGSQMHYIFHNPPALDYINSTYYDLPVTRQVEIAEKFLKETPWQVDLMSHKFRKVYKDSLWGTLYDISENISKTGTKNDRLFRCSNGQLQFLPLTYKQIITSDTTYHTYPNSGAMVMLLTDTNSKKNVGFAAYFGSGYPLEMQTGQKLNDQLTEFSIYSQTTQNAVRFTHNSIKDLSDKNESDILESILENTNKTYGYKLTEEFILKSTINEKWIRNRKVVDSKIVTLNGQSYKAFLIKEEIWTYVGQCPAQCENSWINIYNKKFLSEKNKAMADTWSSKLKPNADGYLVDRAETWYIPGLGPYERKVYNNIGVNIYILELKGYK